MVRCGGAKPADRLRAQQPEPALATRHWRRLPAVSRPQARYHVRLVPPVDAAVGAALILHLVSFGPVTVLGLVLMIRTGLTFRGAVDLASSVSRDRTPELAQVESAGGVVPIDAADPVEPSGT